MLPIDATPYGATAEPWLGKALVPSVMKVGPHGYSHGWIKIGAEDDKNHGHVNIGQDGSFKVRPAGGYAESTHSGSGVFDSVNRRAEGLSVKPTKGDTLVGKDAKGNTITGYHAGKSGSDYVRLHDPITSKTSRSKIGDTRRATSDEHAAMFQKAYGRAPAGHVSEVKIEPVTAASAKEHGKDVVDRLAAKVDSKDPYDDDLLRESSMMDETDLQRGLEYLDNKDPSTYTDAERKVAQHLSNELHGDNYDIDDEEDY